MPDVKINYRRNLKVPANRMAPFSWFVINLKRSSKYFYILDLIMNNGLVCDGVVLKKLIYN
uniref:Uncharacterized protein n=1 Tax=viral metagenome TaxID=1070528 RepID=A0A6C0AEE1_9ZZZZ